MSNSIVHHIPEPAGVLQEALRVLAPGGWIFFRDLLRPETGEDVQRLVQTYAGQESARQQKLFDDSLRAALSLAEIRTLVEPLGFDPETVQATSDRHWTWSGQKV
jgi:SAM-dependent methyltransferase